MALRAPLLSSLILASALLAPSIAHAGGFVTVQVENGAGAVVCLGDKTDPSRFGGAPVIDGRATVLLPREPLVAKGLPTIYLTASDGKRATRIALDGPTAADGLSVKLGKASPGTCKPSRLIKASAVPDLMTSFAEEHKEEILALADATLVTRQFFDQFLEATRRDLDLLFVEAKGMSIIPDARLALISDALARAKGKQDQRRRREEIQRWVAAMEEEARQRRDRVAKHKAAKEAEEAEARNEERDELRVEAEKEFCFGGVGQGCGKFTVGASFSWATGLRFDFDIRKSTCVPDGGGHTCWVNSGSWTHDECCVANPNGALCGGDESSAACSEEWDRAWRRTASWFTWKDHFGTTPVTDGVVDFQAHCAPAGQLIEKPESWPGDNDYGFDDRQLCCSKVARDLHWWEAGPLYTAHALLFYYEPGEVCAP